MVNKKESAKESIWKQRKIVVNFILILSIVYFVANAVSFIHSPRIEARVTLLYSAFLLFFWALCWLITKIMYSYGQLFDIILDALHVLFCLQGSKSNASAEFAHSVLEQSKEIERLQKEVEELRKQQEFIFKIIPWSIGIIAVLLTLGIAVLNWSRPPK